MLCISFLVHWLNNAALLTILGLLADRLKIDKLPDDPQDMGQSFFWRNEFFDLIAEKDHPDFIIVLDRAKGKNSCDLGDHFLFQLMLCSELIGTAHIDQEHHGQFAFFIKNLNEGMIKTSGNIPVNASDIIAELVFPDFTESHSLPFEDAVVVAGKDLIRQAPCFNFDLPNFF